MITLSREALGEAAAAGGPPPLSVLAAVVRRHEQALPRWQRLRRYFEGRNDRILGRGEGETRLPHPIARYIALLSSGYLTGQPVRYEAAGQEEALAALRRLLALSASDSVDSELSLNAAVYGKGVERVYMGPDGLPHIASLSPEEAFVVYDDTVAHAPLFGVQLIRRQTPDGRPDGVLAEVLTPALCCRYRAEETSALPSAALVSSDPHCFGGVPLVEYWNNFDETGDFEPVLPLIDGYDALQTDRLRDKEQFVDSLLVLTGCQLRQTYHTRRVVDEDGMISEEQVPDELPERRLKKDRLLTLPDSDASAQYLSHSFHEADTEVLRAALREDIRRLSLVPDLSDQSFAQNLSGVAMRYKLMGLEQLAAIKERWFREALRVRLRLFAACLTALGLPALDADAVSVRFTRSLPQDREETARLISLLRDVVPKETLLSLLPREALPEGGDA